MRFLENARLYSDTEECLRFLRDGGGRSARADRPNWLCHLYWRGTFGSKQAFAVKSFLATQDLSRCELWLWLERDDLETRRHVASALGDLLDFVTVKNYDPVVLASGTPLEGHDDLLRLDDPVGRSNVVRSLVLFNYGGIYADMDTMFLRDLGEFLADARYSDEFCYSWSATRPHGNSAMLGLRSGSEVAQKLLRRCAERGSCRPRNVLRFSDDRDLDLLVLPSTFFDPLWLHRDRRDNYARAPFDRFDGFFRRFGWRFRRRPDVTSYQMFFPGAFTYHWHNHWDAEEHDNSYFGTFAREFDQILRERYARPSARRA